MNYVAIDKDTQEILDYRDDERFVNRLRINYPACEIIETAEEITVDPETEKYVWKKDILDKLEQERQNEIKMLYMTRLDFVKALESVGISWTTIKGLMEMYPDVEKELMMCSNVYRGNELLDQMAELVDPSITHEVLDQLFIRHQFEQEFNNIELGDLQ